MPQACNVTVAAVSGALDSLLVDCHDWRFVSRPQPLTFVVGHCDKEYTVKLGRERHTCTCPIMRKSKTPCSHVLYVLTRLMGVSTRNPMLHLTCFSDHDLGLFAARRIVQERDPVASVARHADDEGALCAICLDPISVRPTVYCKYGCGASLHRDCFVELVKQQTHTRVVKVTCPCCRATWAPLRTRHRVTALEMLQYRELKPEDYELLLSLEANDVKQPTRANAADVEALETQTYHEDEPCCEGAMPEARTCAICLDDLKEGQTCAKLRCGHYFHDSCVAEWMTKGRATCPLDETPIELLPRVENDPTPPPAHLVAPSPSSPRAVTTTLPAIAPSTAATRVVAAPRLATAARAQRVRRVTAVPSFSPVYVLSDAPTTTTHEIETSFPLASAHNASHIRHLLHRSGRR